MQTYYNAKYKYIYNARKNFSHACKTIIIILTNIHAYIYCAMVHILHVLYSNRRIKKILSIVNAALQTPIVWSGNIRFFDLFIL